MGNFELMTIPNAVLRLGCQFSTGPRECLLQSISRATFPTTPSSNRFLASRLMRVKINLRGELLLGTSDERRVLLKSKKKTRRSGSFLMNFKWCPELDSNQHASRRYPLKIVC